MNPSKDPKYVHIDERCWQRFVDPRWPTLKWLLIALSIDPLEAEDWEMGEADREAPIALGHFADQSHARFRQALETIAVWIEGEGELRPIFKALADYDYRLALWCAAAAIRDLSGRIDHFLQHRENYGELRIADAAAVRAAARRAESAVRGEQERERSTIGNVQPIIHSLCLKTKHAVDLLLREGSKPFTAADALLRASDAIHQANAYVAESFVPGTQDGSDVLAAIRRSMAHGCLKYPLLPAPVDCRGASQ